MKMTIENTTKIVYVNGVSARIWEGTTEKGTTVHCFITFVAVADSEPTEVQNQFKAELAECKAPSPAIEAYPLRMII